MLYITAQRERETLDSLWPPQHKIMKRNQHISTDIQTNLQRQTTGEVNVPEGEG